MRAIDRGGFAPKNLDLTIDIWTRKAYNALYSIKIYMGNVAWLARREPDLRERHVLDKNLGPEIRRTW